MDDEIKKLADKLWRVHPTDIDKMGLSTRIEFYEVELTKFAEMIIKECQVALHPQLRSMISRTEAYNLIKEHFGIES